MNLEVLHGSLEVIFTSNAELAKAIALKNGLHLAKVLTVDPIIMESDAKKIVDVVNTANCSPSW